MRRSEIPPAVQRPSVQRPTVQRSRLSNRLSHIPAPLPIPEPSPRPAREARTTKQKIEEYRDACVELVETILPFLPFFRAGVGKMSAKDSLIFWAAVEQMKAEARFHRDAAARYEARNPGKKYLRNLQ
jgi:hypothetical protein